MIEFLLAPWPWWLSGTLIGITIPLLFILTGKPFGLSTSFQQIGALCTFKKGPAYFSEFDIKKSLWRLFFVIGILAGGFIAVGLLSQDPVQFFPESMRTPIGGIRLLIGGMLIGFGSRYAGGCTSGHAMTGLANLNFPSLIATVCFFIGGVVLTWSLSQFIFPAS